MAITQDGWFNDTMVKALSNTIALDLSNTTSGTYKGALFQSALTPDFSATNPAYGSAPYNANEASGPGYSSGGLNMTVTGFGELGTAANKIGWKFSTLLWTSATISAAGLLVYIPGMSNKAVLLRWFTQTYQAQDGDFSIAFHTDGIWRNLNRAAA
ncbi:hypothetical protein ACIBHX_02080 [Nonomuraea sp. NPDC050536]|uniref:hypothetical protein n=1 Tax=Nonomuraea sp. NPDC050536 TaxID=3364366 RepID=UPI0037CCB9F5